MTEGSPDLGRDIADFDDIGFRFSGGGRGRRFLGDRPSDGAGSEGYQHRRNQSARGTRPDRCLSTEHGDIPEV